MTGEPGDGASDDLPELDRDGLLAELLGVPDRDRCPGARPVVSFSPGDDPGYLAEVQAHSRATVALARRGVDHGRLAELDDSFTFVPRDPLAVLRARWDAARPIVLHDALPPQVIELGADVRRGTAHWGAELLERDGLDRFLRSRRAALEGEYELDPSAPERLDDERDIARRTLDRIEAPGRAGARDLWVKSQRLSLQEDDASVRVRLSFGREGDDDASRDAPRHAAVSALAARLFAEAAAIERDDEITGLVGEWTGAPPLFTQTIAYWNAPNGGALFHHDAFDEPAAGRQRGVLYAQVTGATAWLALSLDDLVARVEEFTELLLDGTLEPVRRELEAQGVDLDGARRAAQRPEHAKRELALPGCGRYAPIVNQGPEFTALLADAGHAFLVGPGDVVVLPNHGFESTCMHSVFCGGDETAFSLSLAIRDRRRAGGGGRRGGRSRKGRATRRARGRGRRGPRSRRGRA